jgi:hypothetical protein
MRGIKNKFPAVPDILVDNEAYIQPEKRGSAGQPVIGK